MSNLDEVIDTGLIEEIHTTVAAALEKYVYRTYIGRFRLHSASGEFSIGNFTGGRRLLVSPSAIKRYELHLDTPGENVPGAGADMDVVGIIYTREVKDHQICRHVEVSFHYPRRAGETGMGAYAFFGIDLFARRFDYQTKEPGQGDVTWRTLSWIHDQLRAK